MGEEYCGYEDYYSPASPASWGWGALVIFARVCVCVCLCPDRGGMKEGRSPPRDEVGGLCMALEGWSFLADL